MCEKCSRDLRDERFHNGYRLIETKMSKTTFKAIEITPIEMVVDGDRARVIQCEVCEDRTEVALDFDGVIKCRACTVSLRVEKLF